MTVKPYTKIKFFIKVLLIRRPKKLVNPNIFNIIKIITTKIKNNFNQLGILLIKLLNNINKLLFKVLLVLFDPAF